MGSRHDPYLTKYHGKKAGTSDRHLPIGTDADGAQTILEIENVEYQAQKQGPRDACQYSERQRHFDKLGKQIGEDH